MRILIGTPAFGGLLTTQYTGSLLLTLSHFMKECPDVKLHTLFLSNESLIPRARNKIANHAIKGGFDKLLFVDADMGFLPTDVEKLLSCGKEFVGGTYPAKEYPLRLVFGLDPAAPTDLETEVVQVKYVPTGFLLLDVPTLKEVGEVATPYRGQDIFTGKDKNFRDFFPTGVRGDTYESEDWGFCSLARDAGKSVHLHTGVVLSHTGTHTFRWDSPRDES